VSEAEKARELSSWFKLRIAAFSVCVSHTPMQQYLQQYRHRRILVLGLKETDVAAVAHEYGFEDVLTIAQLAARHPDLVPHLQHESTGGEAMEQRRQPQHETAAQAAAAVSSSLTSISAVFVMHDPVQWYRDAQILLDVLTAGASPPPLFFTNPDFLFSGQAASPRLAQGAFRVCIAALYEQMTGRPLPYRLMGKPESVSFQWAEKMLAARAEALGFTGGVHRRYMIGDNPRADIRGANRAGPGWVSVLVKTGTIAASDDPQDRPQHVADNVLEAVKWILQREQQEAQKEQHDVTT
jgi:HAD superfamily hydrolase (TIGR01456 family)